MGPGRAELIEGIARLGSISAAARDMGMSYRRAWLLVEAINRGFREPVVVSAIGGRRGGGAEVTPFGLNMVARFRRMEAAASSAIGRELRDFEALVRPEARRK